MARTALVLSVPSTPAAFLAQCDEVDPRIKAQHEGDLALSVRASLEVASIRHEDDFEMHRRIRGLVRTYRLMTKAGHSFR